MNNKVFASLNVKMILIWCGYSKTLGVGLCMVLLLFSCKKAYNPIQNLAIHLENDDLDYEDYIIDPSFITLKHPVDRPLINPRQVEISNQYIYVYDDISDNLMCFNHSGEYIADMRNSNSDFEIDFGIEDFDIDLENNVIYVLDEGSSYIYVLNKNLKFLEKLEIPGFLANEFAYYSESFYFYFNNRFDGININYNLIITDQDLKITAKQFPREQKLEKLLFYPSSIFVKGNLDLYFMPSLSNELYEFDISSSSFKALVTLDFMSHQLDPKDMYDIGYYDMVAKTEGKFSFEQFFIVDKYMFIQGVFHKMPERSTQQIVIDLETQKQVNGKHPFLPLNFGLLKSSYNSRFYSIISSDYVQHYFLDNSSSEFINIESFKSELLYDIYNDICNPENSKYHHLLSFKINLNN